MTDLPPSRRPPPLGLALMVVLALGWGLNWQAMKVALSEIPLWQYRSLTAFAAGSIMLGLASATGQRLAVPRAQWRTLALAAFLNVTCWFTFVAIGVRLMSSGQAALIGFTAPLWLEAINVGFLGERMTRLRLLALGLGVGGIVVLLSHDFAAITRSPWGTVAMLTASLTWACGILVQKRTRWAIDSVPLGGWQLLIGGVPIGLIALATEPFRFFDASPTALWSTAYLVLVSLVLCYYAWFKIVTLLPANVAALSSLLVPVVGVIGGVVLLGEPLGWRELAAMVMIVGAIALILLRPQPA
ncbi:MAG TPA: DMT family transporter [Alphaproteobacteria bacterium]|nr:DMT family transporter [Alphaproteobacteria bacterium]